MEKGKEEGRRDFNPRFTILELRQGMSTTSHAILQSSFSVTESCSDITVPSNRSRITNVV